MSIFNFLQTIYIIFDTIHDNISFDRYARTDSDSLPQHCKKYVVVLCRCKEIPMDNSTSLWSRRHHPRWRVGDLVDKSRLKFFNFQGSVRKWKSEPQLWQPFPPYVCRFYPFFCFQFSFHSLRLVAMMTKHTHTYTQLEHDAAITQWPLNSLRLYALWNSSYI